MTKETAPDTSAVDALLALDPYAPHTLETENIYRRALKETLRHYIENNQTYASFLQRKRFDPAGDFPLADLPFLPTQLFKRTGADISTAPPSQLKLSLSSSATSGIPSVIPVDDVTARRQALCMTRIMKEFLGKERTPFLVLDCDPRAANVAYGARGAAVRGYLRFASSAQYFMTEDNEGLTFLIDKFREAVSALDPEKPVTLFGFTYVLYGELARRALESGERFALPNGSRVLHIGGWKKLEAEKVSRKKFESDLESVLGVKPENIIDVYGFTEHMGLNYPDCPCGCKHVPHASRLVVRDPVTLEPLPAGKKGVLEFISPLPYSYAGAAALTDDVGEKVDGECPYGRGGERFIITGRLPKAEPRGCGDIMGEKMRGARPIVGAKSDELRIGVWGNEAKDITEVARNLRANRDWLISQPAELIAGLIGEVAQDWIEDSALAAWRKHGLHFLSQWCSRANLLALASTSLRGMPEALDGFVPERDRKTHYMRALPAGLAVHWASGNVPFLSLLVLVQSLVAKNLNIIKTAGNNFDLLRGLLSKFEGREYASASGSIKGSDLLKTLALVHYPHNNRVAAEVLSKVADVRVAWGGREAIDAICSLPSRASCVDIVFGPKLSFMVIARDALKDEASVRKALRRAATDVSSFDQAACSSPHTIFVEKGGFISPEEFARRLADAMQIALSRVPPFEESEAQKAAVETARATGAYMGQCWHSDGPGWTVIYDEESGLAKPVYSRVITVRPIGDIMEAAAFCSADIQTVGLAGEGERRVRFAEAAARNGAMRFPEIGSMTGFDNPWDGVYVMDRFVRWVSLGGAASAIAK